MIQLRRVTVLVLALCMLVSATAVADIKRGDRGDDVAALQQLLFEDGWLFELPDGVFGANTEQAVKDFERFASLPVDGIADPQMIYELYVARDVLYEELGIIPDFYYDFEDVDDAVDGGPYGDFGTGGVDIDYSYDPEEDGPVGYAECCTHGLTNDGSSYIDYCEVHNDLHFETYKLLDSGDPEQARQASDMWYTEVIRLYDEWAMLLPEADRNSVYDNRASYLASIDTQRSTLNYDTMSDSAIVMTEVSICNSLRYQASWLCGLIWQERNGGIASEEGVKPVVLNESAIVDGDDLYFSGSISGYGYGVFVMDRDGENIRQISDISCMLVGICDGYLLVWDYTGEEAVLKVLYPDGTLENVGYSYNWHSVAHEGRFYFGGTSVAKDGYDHQWILSSDPERHDNYFPVEILDGYMYYLDLNDSVYTGVDTYHELPANAALKRLNLENGDIEPVSDFGTRFIGVDDGMIYYTRSNYVVWDENYEEIIEIEVDDGLYVLNPEVMAETKLVDFSEEDYVFDSYIAVENGIVYGERVRYIDDSGYGDYSIIRVDAGGNMLPEIPIEWDHALTSLTVEDGVYYAAAYGYYEDDYDNSGDKIIAVDTIDGHVYRTDIIEGATMFYVEAEPDIAVADGRVYYMCIDENYGAEYFVSMNTDGSDVKVLVEYRYD